MSGCTCWGDWLHVLGSLLHVLLCLPARAGVSAARAGVSGCTYWGIWGVWLHVLGCLVESCPKVKFRSNTLMEVVDLVLEWRYSVDRFYTALFSALLSRLTALACLLHE